MDPIKTENTQKNKKVSPASLDFEQAFGQLESLVNSLESPNLPLEDALKQFEKGIQLTQRCQKVLSKAEQKVQVLIKKNNNLNLEDIK